MQTFDYGAVAQRIIGLSLVAILLVGGAVWLSAGQQRDSSDTAAQPEARLEARPQPTTPTTPAPEPRTSSVPERQTGRYSRTWSSSVNGHSTGGQQAWTYDNENGWQRQIDRSW